MITVFFVANAQKQEVAQAECIEASDTTMFQELAQSLECRVQSAKCRVESAECRVQNAECRV